MVVARILSVSLLIVVYYMPSGALAVVFEQCFKDIRANMTGQTGGIDINGKPVANITEAMGITYGRCIEWCSAAPENFDFPTFSRKFTAWLLPWLALISQLPFNGSNSKEDDVLSVLLAVGSPTLAGYSLALTAANTSWLHRRILRLEEAPKSVLERIERVLNCFQTMRLRIERDDLMKVVSFHTESEGDSQGNLAGTWWEEVDEGLDYAPQGAVSAATALGWVFIAYLFTVIDAFTSLQTLTDTYGLGNGVSPDGVSDGQGVGSIWLWLLPVVIGWLIIEPKYQGDLNDMALKNASRRSGRSPMKMALRERGAYPDEIPSAPIFNYARLRSWTNNVEEVLGEYEERFPATTQQALAGPEYIGRFFRASIAGLALQWGTAGGAIIIHWFTPTVGLGCRSLNWLIYAGASTTVWMILVTSSYIAAYPADHIQTISAILRVLGQILAACNAMGIITTCVIQFGNFYNRCYCNSVVTQLGSRAYDVFWVRNVGDIKRPWVGGVALGIGTAALFLFTICVWLPSKPRKPQSARFRRQPDPSRIADPALQPLI